MISLDKIVTSNLEMLKSQEEELLKSLSFVQKAKQLFQAQWGTGTTETKSTRGKKRGRPSGSTAKPKVAAAPKSKTRKSLAKAKPAKKTGEKRISHLTNIIETLKKNGKPMGSGDLISSLFKRQTADKDIKHFRLLIYPVLTKAYANKTLKLKDGKIYLAK